jgi:hypothetical protein
MNKHRSILNYLAALGLLLALATLGIGCKKTPVENRDMEQDARALQQFTKGVDAYVVMHDRLEKALPAIKATASGAKIVQRQRSLAAKVQAARRNAKEGAIFTPDVTAYFRREINVAYLTNAEGIQAGAETGPAGKLIINQPYPEDAPHRMMPPTVLLHLPKLPELMQYDILGHDLIIRDLQCDLVVDVARNVIP